MRGIIFVIAIYVVVGVLAKLLPQPTVYKVTPQHNAYEVGITCTNGGDPAGIKVGDMLIVSCGKD